MLSKNVLFAASALCVASFAVEAAANSFEREHSGRTSATVATTGGPKTGGPKTPNTGPAVATPTSLSAGASDAVAKRIAATPHTVATTTTTTVPTTVPTTTTHTATVQTAAPATTTSSFGGVRALQMGHGSAPVITTTTTQPTTTGSGTHATATTTTAAPATATGTRDNFQRERGQGSVRTQATTISTTTPPIVGTKPPAVEQTVQ